MAIAAHTSPQVSYQISQVSYSTFGPRMSSPPLSSPLYMRSAWLQPDHPDPRCEQLPLLAKALEELNAASDGSGGSGATATVGGGSAYAVFFDFCSLHQLSTAGAGARSPREEALFRLATHSLADWYAHQASTMLVLRELPQGYPLGYTFPQRGDSNHAPFEQRGWCFLESTIASAVRPAELLVEIGGSVRRHATESVAEGPVARHQRPPPLTASHFCESVDRMTFADKERDLPIVKELYRRTLQLYMSSLVTIDGRGCLWGDREVVALVETLREARPPNLKLIDVSGNAMIGGAGVSALADALQRGVAPSLRRVWFGSGTPRGESGVADESGPFAIARKGYTGLGGAPRMTGLNALAKHPAWDATGESWVRVEGAQF